MTDEQSTDTHTTVGDAERKASMGRKRRPLVSRIIDQITEALGHEMAFVLAVVMVVVWFAGLPHYGFDNQNYQLLINTGTTIVTFIMVFAVQHTSNRDAQALHVKLDELLRVTEARNELMGVEGETAGHIRQWKQELESERDRDLEGAAQVTASEASRGR